MSSIGVGPVVSLSGCKEVGPFELAGALLAFCVTEGWLIRAGREGEPRYFVTPDGAAAFRAFNIDIDLS